MPFVFWAVYTLTYQMLVAISFLFWALDSNSLLLLGLLFFFASSR